jgi:mycothiol synthase
MPSPLTSASLPDALASAFELDRVGPRDEPEIFALVSACDVAVLGFPDVSLGDIASQSGPLIDGSDRPQAVVRRVSNGEVVSWWFTDPTPESPRCFGDVYVDPSLPEPDADALAAAGWAGVEAWAWRYLDSSLPEADARSQARLTTGILNGDRHTERRVAAVGFERVRTFWRMSAQVPAGGTGAPSDAGIDGPEIVPATDLPLVHRLRTEAFADHWGGASESYETWMARKTSEPGHDLSMWFVALIDGEPAGFMICSRQMEDDNALYVATLGTLSAYRRRGVASALLQRGFELARDEDYGSVRLGVDSDSPTGAPSVYRRAGFEVLFAMHVWEKPLNLDEVSPAPHR